MKLFLLFFFSLAAGPSAHALSWTQSGWLGGAVSGATTTAVTTWTHYASSDSTVNVTAGGLAIDENVPSSWTQTDDGVSASGFNRSGSVLSTVTVTGTGTAAQLTMVLGSTVTVRPERLPEFRGDMSVMTNPGTGDIFFFGGRRSNGTISNQIGSYTPVTDSTSTAYATLPADISEAGISYYEGTRSFFLFGGWNGSQRLESIYSYTPNLNLAAKRATVFPSSRTLISAANDSSTGLIYLFGGLDFQDNPLNSIYRFNGFDDSLNPQPTNLPTARYGVTAVYHPVKRNFYIFGGNDGTSDLDEVLEYDPVGNLLSAMTTKLPTPRSKVAAVYHTQIAKIVLFGGVGAGGPTDDIMIFDAVNDTMTILSSVLPSARAGMAVALDSATVSSRIFGFGASSGTSADFNEILDFLVLSSGNYVSEVFDTKNLSDLTAISWNPTVPFDGEVGLGVGFRAGDTPTPDAVNWTNAGGSLTVTNGGSLTSFGDHRYVQYIASFTTTNVSTSAVLKELTIAYSQTPSSATLQSSVFDTQDFFSVVQAIRWEGTFPANTTAQFQIRTASDNGSGFPATFTSWLGPTATTDFYTDPGGGDILNAAHRDAVDDRFLQYQAILLSSNTASTPVLSSVTIVFNAVPSSPTLTSLTALTTTQVEVRFTDRATTEDEFYLRYGFTLDNIIGVSTVPTVDKAGTGTSYIQTISGFTPNRLLFVSARSHILPPVDLVSSSAPETEANIFTLANPPSDPAITDVSGTSITLTWNANANPGITQYEVQYSSENFATTLSSAVPFGNLTDTTTDFNTPDFGTTYYIRIKARNNNAIETAYSATVSTQTRPLDASGLALAGIGVTSITWNWNTSGPAVSYRVFETTTNAVLAVVHGTSFTQTSLGTNTFHGIYIEPFNGYAPAGLSAHISTYTLAAPPTSLTATFNSTDTIALAWDGGGNPVNTRFEILRSTDDFTANISTLVPFSAGFGLTQYVAAGLNAGTTYYFKIRAQNFALVPTSFDARVSTPTLGSRLVAPTVAALGISSITWNWNATAGPTVLSYDLFLASGSGAVNDSTGIITGHPATTLTETGLGPNSRHVIQVSPRNTSGIGELSAPTTVFTLANPPVGTALNTVFVSSVVITFDTQGNTQLFTGYDVFHSTDGAEFVSFSTFTLSPTGSTRTLTPFDLKGFTTHYFRVRARNNADIPTAFDVTVSTFLLGEPPAPPTGFTAESIPGRLIKLGWTISLTTTVVQYSLYSDNGTGTIDYSVLFASVTGDITAYLTPPLTDGTTYLFNLRARDEIGLEENNSSAIASAVAQATPFPVGARIATPKGGVKVSGDHLSVVAQLTRGSPSSVSQVLFQYRNAGIPPWIDITAVETRHPNPATVSPYSVHWNVSILTSGHYDLRAVARDTSGTDDPFPPTLRFRVDPSDPDIQELDLGGGRIQKRLRLYDSVSAETTLADSNGPIVTTVRLSSGALSVSPTFLRIISNPSGIPQVPVTLADPKVFRQITLESGQTVLANNRTAEISFAGLDQDGNNRVDDHEIRTDNLAIFIYDATAGRWRREFGSSVAPGDYVTVSGKTPHFSLFGLFSPASSDLSEVRIYPNPYKPNGSDAEEGKPYSTADPTTGILFDNLTATSRIKVYTINGALVWQSENIIHGGLYRWNVRNGDGTDVASGIYFAVILSDGEDAIIRKIAVIR